MTETIKYVKRPIQAAEKKNVVSTYAIKRVPNRDPANLNDSIYLWNVYRVDIDEKDKVDISMVKSCGSKAEAIADFQRRIAADVVFGKTY